VWSGVRARCWRIGAGPALTAAVSAGAGAGASNARARASEPSLAQPSPLLQVHTASQSFLAWQGISQLMR